MSEEIKQKVQEREQQNEEILPGDDLQGIPVALEKISESEVNPEDAQPITTSLAQNLDITDQNPLPTTPSQEQPEEEEEEPEIQDLSQSQYPQEQQHRDAGVIYGADGVLRSE